MGETQRHSAFEHHAPTTGLARSPATVSLSCPAWPLSCPNTQLELEAWFAGKGIDYSRPGLHDSPEFLHAEHGDSRALERLARYVESRHYSADELQDAQRKISAAAAAVFEAVERDGLPGRSIVASGALSRILDKLGVWNYVAKANVAVRFPTDASLETHIFHAIDMGRFEPQHTIVVAPPFNVIDLAIRHQAYPDLRMAKAAPQMVASVSFQPYDVAPSELLAPEMRTRLRLEGIPEQEYLLVKHRRVLDIMQELPSRQILFGPANNAGAVGYGIVGVGGFGVPLEDLSCLIDGRTPAAIYEAVLPML